MGVNKAQKQAAERAKASTPAATAVAEQPKAEQPKAQPVAAPAPAAAAPVATKQTATISRLKEGWKSKGVDLSKLVEQVDGKFVNLIVAAGWPTVRVGNSGGITVMELKSYVSAFDAAMEGKARLDKQNEREAKKVAQPAPPATQPAKETVNA